MSVLVVLRVTGDPRKVEEYSSGEGAAAVQQIVEAARRRGVIRHRFYGGEGEVLVVDEWPSEEAFNAFFEESAPLIQPMMAIAGAGQPQVSFWRPLATGDEVG